MKPADLVVRCMARREGDLYVAVCIDLTLAAQGNLQVSDTSHLRDFVGRKFDPKFLLQPNDQFYLREAIPLRNIFGGSRVCDFQARIVEDFPEHVYDAIFHGMLKKSESVAQVNRWAPSPA